jgi:hypothetical protein
MTLAEFKKLAEKIGTVERFNTCNDWGFGGSFGTRYAIGDYIYRDSKYSTRHNGTYKNNCLYILKPNKDNPDRCIKLEACEISKFLKNITREIILNDIKK